MKQYDAIGVIEAQYYPVAVGLLDQVVKTADVTFLASENDLGGKLVSIIVGGSIANVTEAIEVVKASDAASAGYLKKALVITKPHEEIMKFIIKKPKPKRKTKKQPAKKQAPKEDK